MLAEISKVLGLSFIAPLSTDAPGAMVRIREKLLGGQCYK